MKRLLVWSLVGCVGASFFTGCGAHTQSEQWSPASHSASAPAAQAFAAYWPNFRAALLAGRFKAISPMTHFPLELRGETDDVAVRRISESELPRVLERALAADTGLSLRARQSNRQLVDAYNGADPAPRGVNVGADAARVGAFAFARTPAGWRLARIYVSE